MTPKLSDIFALSDGKRTSTEIAAVVGLSPRYVRRLQHRFSMPRPNEGAQPNERNHQFVSGRRIDLDGYVLVTAPSDHPYARLRTHRQTKLIYEHRLILEHKLGRYLLPEEVVDHIDGLTLHNKPENLRLFPNNSEHLRSTIAGMVPRWSPEGKKNILARFSQEKDFLQVNTYGLRRKLGEIRLRQTLLAWLSLDKDSPYLLGTHRLLQKTGIDWSDRSSLKRALDDLYVKWGWDHTQ